MGGLISDPWGLILVSGGLESDPRGLKPDPMDLKSDPGGLKSGRTEIPILKKDINCPAFRCYCILFVISYLHLQILPPAIASLEMNNNCTTTTALHRMDERIWLWLHLSDPDYQILEYVILIIDIIEYIVVIFFLVEYLVRLIICPKKIKFFFELMNMIDFFALIPFFLSILLEGLEDFEIVGKTGKIIRLIRVMRILRKVSLIFSTEKV